MNTPEASFLAWQQQFRTSKDCLHYLKDNEVAKWVYVSSLLSQQRN